MDIDGRKGLGLIRRLGLHKYTTMYKTELLRTYCRPQGTLVNALW